jgi:hypothetical protein
LPPRGAQPPDSGRRPATLTNGGTLNLAADAALDLAGDASGKAGLVDGATGLLNRTQKAASGTAGGGFRPVLRRY